MREYEIVKKIYFIILAAIIIGFTVGVIFELNRKNSTPQELLKKIPAFFENLISPTTTTLIQQTKKSSEYELSKLITQREARISNIEHILKILQKEKDKKKKKELCANLYNLRKSLKQLEKNMKSIINEDALKKYKLKDKRIGMKISRMCYFFMGTPK